MATVYSFLKAEASKAIGSLKSKLGYAALTTVLEIARAAVAAKHPDWPLPSVEQILAAGGALVGAHTLMDFMGALIDLVNAWRQTPTGKQQGATG